MARRSDHTKDTTVEKVVQSAPAVRVSYPKESETLSRPSYTFRIEASPKVGCVEVSIDQGGWMPCREAMGLWWYDWSGYAQGRHVVTARTNMGNGLSAASAPRRFTVA